MIIMIKIMIIIGGSRNTNNKNNATVAYSHVQELNLRKSKMKLDFIANTSKHIKVERKI